ncbi:MAG TPA: pitrilysin family protein [Vicinamibacterales bacterium]|jgi:predicted Zn-dependent peptidase|nr:pitrilysin family protein [Vicinamibacterales bacterium]
MPVDRTRLPPLGPDPAFTFPAIRKTMLSSGVRFWTVEHHDVPLVAYLLLMPTGAAADPSNRPGLAAMTGDMLDEGCGDHSALDVHDTLGRLGAHFDIEVGSDATLLSLTTLARFAGQGLELVADMVRRPRFDENEFNRVRDLRLTRLLQLRDLAPAVADRAFARLVYGNHPYGHLPIGSEASLRDMTRAEAVGFHSRSFVPSRATLIAVGDALHEELLDHAERQFGGWTALDDVRSDESDPALMDVPATPPDRLALVHREGSAQSELRIGHAAVPRSTSDYHALLVLNMILGGQFVSRINLNLREDKGFTYGARTAFDFRRGRGPFVLQVSVQTDATTQAIRESLAELTAIRGERPATSDELTLARAALTRGYPRGFETAEQVARATAQLALYGLPDDYFSQFVPRISAVDSSEVTRVAREHLDPSRLLTVVVGDRDKIGASLARLDLGASELAVT